MEIKVLGTGCAKCKTTYQTIEKVKVAGATGTIQLPNGEYAVEFCGYFPASIRSFKRSTTS